MMAGPLAPKPPNRTPATTDPNRVYYHSDQARKPIGQTPWADANPQASKPAGQTPWADFNKVGYTLGGVPQGPAGNQTGDTDRGIGGTAAYMPYPGATYPGQQGSLADQLNPLNDQLRGLQDQARNAQTGAIREDLASQLLGLDKAQEWSRQDVTQGTGRANEDMSRVIGRTNQDSAQAIARRNQDSARQIALLRQLLPKQLEGIGDEWASRGLAGSGREGLQRREHTQTVGREIGGLQRDTNRFVSDVRRDAGRTREDVTRDTQRYISDLNRDADRDTWTRDRQREAAQKTADRQLTAIEREHQADLIAGKIKTLEQAEGANRTEAVAWTRARENQLLAAGVDPSTARSMAIAEARDHWGNVDPTFIEGFSKPDALPDAPADPIAKKWGVEIGGDRATRITPRKQDQIRKSEDYKQSQAKLDEYVRMAGGAASPEGFIQFWADTLARTINPDTGKLFTEKEVRAKIQSNAPMMSMVFFDEGMA